MSFRTLSKIISGRQLVAARGLAGIRQLALAKAAGISRNAVSYWEGRATMPKCEPYAVRKMREAFAGFGVAFFATPFPGVSLAAAAPTPEPNG